MKTERPAMGCWRGFTHLWAESAPSVMSEGWHLWRCSSARASWKAPERKPSKEWIFLTSGKFTGKKKRETYYCWKLLWSDSYVIQHLQSIRSLAYLLAKSHFPRCYLKDGVDESLSDSEKIWKREERGKSLPSIWSLCCILRWWFTLKIKKAFSMLQIQMFQTKLN